MVPGTNTMDRSFRSRRNGNPHLSGEEHRSGIIPDQLQEAFPGEPPKDLTNCYRADTAVWLGDGN